MKEYYVGVERQGYQIAIVKVEAEGWESAKGKAALSLMADRDFVDLEERQALKDSEELGIMMLDQDGEEI